MILGNHWSPHNISLYVTGFVKRGLPRTSNSMNLEDHNFMFKKHANLKFSQSITVCWYSLLSKVQGNNFFPSEVMNAKVHKLDVRKTPFRKSGHTHIYIYILYIQ